MSGRSFSTSARDASVGGAIRLAVEVVVRTSSIIATLWLTRSLGVSAFGSFLLALSVGLMIAELCDLGLNSIVVPMVVRNHRNLRTLFGMKAAMTAGVVALGLVGIPFASRLSGLDAGVLALCAFHFLGASWIAMMGATLRSLGRRIDEATLLFAFRFALVVLVIGAPFGASVSGAAAAYALSVVPAALLGLAFLRNRPGADGPAGADVPTIARHALPMGANGYLSILSTRVELFLLQAAQGAEAVGLFGGALRIVESLLTLPTAVAAGALPSLARDVVNGSKGAAQRTFGIVVWIGAPAALGLARCAPEVLQVLGPGFGEAAPALRILSAALFLCFANAALFHLLIAEGDTAVIPRLTALRLAVASAGGLLMIPAFGLVGAALSFTAAELLLFGALIRRTRGRSEVEVLRPVALALLACVPMIAVLSLWRLTLSGSIAAGALLFGAASFVILRRGTEQGGLA
jgi:O-antigen/teichoic acid export membrane protein